MSEPLEVGGVRVPGEAISFRAVRASGPGGQNVNKVSSKVELRVDLSRVSGLSEAARARLLALARTRLDAEGRLVVTSQKTRDQSRNLEDARERVRELLLRGLAAPKKRIATPPGRRGRERRLHEKRLQSDRKRGRGRPPED